MKRVMALIIKTGNIWLKRIAKIASVNQLHDSIDVSVLHEAQDLLFKMVQDQSFTNEKKLLLKSKMVSKGCSIVKLDSFLENKDILMIGSRFKRSFLK